MKKQLACLILIITLHLSCTSNHDSAGTPLDRAKNAYFQMEHANAYALFTRVNNDSTTSNEDKAEAARSKAKMEWLFYNQPDSAFKTLASLRGIDDAPNKTLLLESRILDYQLKFSEAIDKDHKAIDLAQSETEKYHASLSYCRHALKQYKHDLLSLNADSLGKQQLERVYPMLRGLFQDKPGDVEVAKVYLSYSLLLGKGIDAFDGWMSYFRLTDISQVHPSLMKSPGVFREALERFAESRADPAILSDIFLGLAESGFYELAFLFNERYPSLDLERNTRVNDVISYYQFLVNVDELTSDFYLDVLNDKANRSTYTDLLLAEAETLWDQLYWSTTKPEFSKDPFEREIRKRFKALIEFIDANGYWGLHMGHVILDDRRMVEQYDERAEFRYIAIDHMVSNGYSAWFWDGLAETGGWAGDDGSFLQVRSAYTSGPTNAWMMVTDSVETIETERKIRELSQSDDSIALVNPYAFLPGLSQRMNYEENKKLLDSLSGQELSGRALRLRFINVNEAITQGHSIYSHEGRHAIDKKNQYSWNTEELEYTAKLSQVYFTTKPKMAIRAILSRNIGDGTSHGEANLRVIKGIVSWMEDHKTEISHYDPGRPTLPQLDLLTDGQLKKAVRSLDPLSNG